SGSGSGSGSGSLRAEWTLATMLRAPPYAVPKGVANVVAHVPTGWDPTKKIDLVIYFHGAVQCAAQLAQVGDVVCKPGDAPLGGYGYDARHDDAGKNTLFALPQFAFFGGGSAGKMTEQGYFTSFVAELMSETFAGGAGGPHGLDDVGSITLVGHSAGFNPVLTILSRGELAAKVRNVVLLDAMFAGGEDYYADWFAKKSLDAMAPAPKFVAVYGDSGDSSHHHASVVKKLKAKAAKLAYLPLGPKGSLVDLIRDNDVVVTTLPVNHYWMPTMLLSKVIAGLDLPARAMVVPSVVGAVPVRVSLGLDAKVAGSLDEGDATLTNGAFADEYALKVAAGDAVTVSTSGGKSLTETCCTVDVLTQVFDGDTLVASDDDGAGLFDSRIVFTAKTATTYTVRVTTSGAGYKRGPYSVSVARGASPSGL
ncbi:MAG: PPC domain-containing protein, partial [Polyangiales bacterium]